MTDKIFIPAPNWKKTVMAIAHHWTVQSAQGEGIWPGQAQTQDTVPEALGEEAQLQSTSTKQFGSNF